MNRRDAISAAAIFMGGSLIGMDALISGCKTSKKESGILFSSDDILLLDEIGETIIPATDTPGAKAAKIGAFIAKQVSDCYVDQHQKIFTQGLITLNKQCKEKMGNSFMDNNAARRLEFLNTLDVEQKAYSKEEKNKDTPHYFRLMKELTLFGYFTSEIGAKQALRYIEVPGRYEGCIPYKKGDKAWA
jgi:hypothetical protein